MIEFSYDPEVSMAYVTLSKQEIIQTIDLEEFGLRVDIDADGSVVGVEIEE